MTFGKWLAYLLGAPLDSAPAPAPVDVEDVALEHIRGEIVSLRTESNAMERRLVTLERKQQHSQNWLANTPDADDPEVKGQQ